MLHLPRFVLEKTIFLCLVGTLLLFPFLSEAKPVPSHAYLCLEPLLRHQQNQSIPPHLLFSIALNESGLWNATHLRTLPWPWTVNVEGKGYYFDSPTEAVRFIRIQQKRGIKNIDVGCMQVNLAHHPHAFHTIEEALHPDKNIAYAASFLKSLYIKHKDWTRATASYHSSNDIYGIPYANKVKQSWEKEKISLSFNKIMHLSPYYTNNLTQKLPPIPTYKREFRVHVKERRNSPMFVATSK